MRPLLAFIGIIALLAGLVLLFLALGPQFNTQEQVLGGASLTQEDLAAQSAAYGDFNEVAPPDLPVQVDGSTSTTNQIAAQPEITDQGFAELSDLNSEESAAVAEINAASAESLPQAQAVASDAASVVAANVPLNPETEVALVPLATSFAAAPTDLGQGGAGVSGRTEQRVVELEWPRAFRVGGTATVRLTLRPAGGNLQAVAEIPENAVIATPIILTDMYDTHTAKVTARLVAPDFEVEAITPLTQDMARNQDVGWRWTLNAPDNSGTFTLTFAVNIEWTPRPGTGLQASSRAIWGQAVQAEVNYVFAGFSVPQASTLGGVLALGGFIAQLPFAGEVVSYFLGRRRPRRTTRRSSSRRNQRR